MDEPIDIHSFSTIVGIDIANHRIIGPDIICPEIIRPNIIELDPCKPESIDIINEPIHDHCRLCRRVFSITHHCKGCDFSNTNNFYNRLQIQKKIQNVVRVPSSLYQDNLSALNVYEKPLYINQTNHNQSSDRLQYHIQQHVVPSHCNTTKHTRTNCRPGASSPGGAGVDIKHNSYARYLNRIKGKGPYRQGIIPKEQILPYIPFNLVKPVYGDKLVKLNIINRCNCLY